MFAWIQAHWSYLDIYISQKCSWFGRQISNQHTGQTNQLFGLEIQIYHTHFSFIFCRICQTHCFLQKIAIQICQLFGICKSNSVKKQRIWQILQKIEEKWVYLSIIDLNFQTKKMISLTCRLVWNKPSKSAWIFVKCKCPKSFHITDERTDVWPPDFIIWKIDYWLWAVVWAGLWNKKVWADYEQLLRPVFLSFYGQKII